MDTTNQQTNISGVTIDGTPIELFKQIGEQYHTQLNEKAKESTFNNKILSQIQITKEKDIYHVNLITADYKNGYQSHNFDIDEQKQIIDYINDNNIYIDMFHDTPIQLINNDNHTTIMSNNTNADFAFYAITYFTESNINSYENIKNKTRIPADITHAYTNTDKSIPDIDKKIKNAFNQAEMNFIYNERNWRTDYCIINLNNETEETMLEFDSIHEENITENIQRMYNPDTKMIFNDFFCISGTVKDIQNEINRLEQNNMPDYFLGYDNSAVTLKEITTLITNENTMTINNDYEQEIS